MYKLVLLRHGESLWNRDNIFTGWVDIGLSDFGKIQSQQAGKILKENNFIFDVAFTSVLKRATQTLEIVLDKMGQSNILIEKSWQLNERHYGLLQGMDKKEAVKKFGMNQVMAWRRSFKEKPPALVRGDPPLTESLEDVCLRVVPYWEKEIVPCIMKGERILISAHGNSLRALIKNLDNISDKDIENLNIPTGVPLVYEFNEKFEPVKKYYLGNDLEIKKEISKVENQVK